jgi:hypothetical protein
VPSNDNHAAPPASFPILSDAHGHAALLLVESLIHDLVERSVLTVEQSIGIIETAIDVQVDVARDADGAGAPMWHAHALLVRIADSLRHDVNRSPSNPDL